MPTGSDLLPLGLLALLLLRSDKPAPKAAPALPAGGGLRVFPVASSGRPSFAEAFGSHRGTDIFAPAGTPVLAVDDGRVRAANDPKGGRVAYLNTASGAVYYYAHLDQYAGTFPRAVSAGEMIGTVGTTGNARGTTPHLHFEVHPNGGEAVNPFPLLRAVQQAAAQVNREVPRVLTGGQPLPQWFAERFGLALEVLGPNVPPLMLRDIALSVVSQWAHETARGAAEFNFNLGGWRARETDRYFVARDAMSGSEVFRWTAYSDLPNAVHDQLRRLHDRYPTAWALLLAEPNSSRWTEELGRRGYYTARPENYARAWATNRAELGALAA